MIADAAITRALARLAALCREAFLVAAVLLASGWAAEARAQSYRIMVYSQPTAGEESAFAHGQAQERIPAALKIPGFKSAQRFLVKRADTPILGGYLTVYRVKTNDIAAAAAALAGLGRSPAELSAVTAIYADMGAVVRVPQDVPDSTAKPLPVPGRLAMRRYFLFAHLSAGEGLQNLQAFNEMYDRTHLPDVLRNPGFLWGARGKLVSVDPGRFAPSHLAVYEFQTFDLDVSIAEVVRRLRVGITRPFPPGSVNRGPGGGGMVYYAEPVGPERRP